jgi:Acetyltransferase (GNAT) domain
MSAGPGALGAARGPSVVVRVDPLADPRWDEFVRSHDSSSIYHLGIWSHILRSAYGFTAAYLALEADGRLEGVLPLMSTRGVVTGRRLRSLPAVGSIDPLARSQEGKRALLEAACEMALEQGARSWTLRARQPGYEALEPRLRVSGSKTFIAPLPDDPDALRASWKKSANNLWRSLKKADEAGVSVREGTSERDLRRFYAMYCETMRRHRSLPRSYRMLSLAQRSLSSLGLYRLLLAEHDGEVVAGGMFFAWRDTVDLVFNASSARQLHLRPNHAVYWSAIRWAIENGYRRYNMGDAPIEGSLGRFKAQWGGEPVDRFRYDFTPGERAGAAEAMRRASTRLDAGEGRESLLSRVWGHAPLIATRLAGQLAYRFF